MLKLCTISLKLLPQCLFCTIQLIVLHLCLSFSFSLKAVGMSRITELLLKGFQLSISRLLLLCQIFFTCIILLKELLESGSQNLILQGKP
eukprot:Skav230437  [mRNA]  locus=scaffold1601:191888:192157:+ [translate_table: standard]